MEATASLISVIKRSLTGIFVLCLVGTAAFSQTAKKYPFEKWEAKTIEEASVNKNVTGISNDEKTTLFLINMLRADPKLFWQTYAKEYIDSVRFAKDDPYITALKNDLFKAKPARMMEFDADLYKQAAGHAEKSGQSGKMGHAGYEDRVKALPIKFKNSHIAENLQYGHGDPLTVIMMWLIDDGDKDAAHRKALLDNRYKFIGLAIRPHKKYESNAVALMANPSYFGDK